MRFCFNNKDKEERANSIKQEKEVDEKKISLTSMLIKNKYI